MKIAIIILSVLGSILLLFGCWGRYSEAGKSKFDEMAGMIPYGAYYLGIILVIISIILFLVRSKS